MAWVSPDSWDPERARAEPLRPLSPFLRDFRAGAGFGPSMGRASWSPSGDWPSGRRGRLAVAFALSLAARCGDDDTPRATDAERSPRDAGARADADSDAGPGDNGRPAPTVDPDEVTLAFVDVTVLPMTGEGPLPHHTVLVAGDRIAQVGPADGIPVPEGVARMDGPGWLLPGLVDAHVHVRTPSDLEGDLLLYVANGITTVRNMAGAAFHLGIDAAVARGEMIGPHFSTTGPAMGLVPRGTPPPVGERDDGPEAAEASVRAQHEAGYDAIKVYSFLSAASHQRIAEIAGAIGLPVVGHVPDRVSLDAALARQFSIEHLSGFPETIDAALAQRVVASGVWNVPTLAVHEGNERIATYRSDPPPGARYVRACTLDKWREASPSPDTALAASLERTETLHRAGARLLAGTDASATWVVPGFSLHRELELLASRIGDRDALALATVRPAEAFGTNAGTVEPGRVADLLLVDADPTETVSNLRRPHIRATAVAGRLHRAADLVPPLEALAERRAAETCR